MIRTHMIVTVQTHDFHWKRTMAYHLEKTAQNRSVAPLRRAAIESDYGPSGKEFYRGLVFGRYLLFRTCFGPHVACNLIHVWAHLPDFGVACQLFEVRELELDLVPGYAGKNADSSSLAAIGVQMGPKFRLRLPVLS